MPGIGAVAVASKKTLRAAQQTTPAVIQKRQAYQQNLATQATARFKFLDESSLRLNMTRAYGRAAPSERVVEHAAHYPGSCWTTVAIIGLEGVLAPMMLSGAMTGAVFYEYLAHKVAGLEDLLKAHGASLLYLPPYSPDLHTVTVSDIQGWFRHCGYAVNQFGICYILHGWD